MTLPRTLTVTASTLVLIGAAGCGGGSTTQSSNAAVDKAPSVTITSPQKGAMVGTSFPVTFKTSVPIGPLDTGEDHVHVVVDGNTDDFAVVTAHRTMVKNLSPGKHTIGVTLQHADHSSAGAEDQISVTVGKGAAKSGGDMKGSGADDSSGSSSGNSYGRGY